MQEKEATFMNTKKNIKIIVIWLFRSNVSVVESKNKNSVAFFFSLSPQNFLMEDAVRLF